MVIETPSYLHACAPFFFPFRKPTRTQQRSVVFRYSQRPAKKIGKVCTVSSWPRKDSSTVMGDFPRVSSLFVYPVKACQGTQLQEAELTTAGTLKYDREWCVVDAHGIRYPKMQALSQRLCPVLASISVSLDVNAARMTLGAPGMDPHDISLLLPGVCSASGALEVDCSGASTTSAGSWSLGVLAAQVVVAAVVGEVAVGWLPSDGHFVFAFSYSTITQHPGALGVAHSLP